MEETESPLSRANRSGYTNLSLRECLSVLIGKGQDPHQDLQDASSLLNQLGPFAHPKDRDKAFYRLWQEGELFSRSGRKTNHLDKVLAAQELSRRAQLYEKNSKKRFRKKEPLLSKFSNELIYARREWVGFIPIFSQMRIGDFQLIQYGTRRHVHFDIQEVFRQILMSMPEGFFFFHNHPSGCDKPSDSDYIVTYQLRELAEMLETPLQGHGIVHAKGISWIDDPVA